MRAEGERRAALIEYIIGDEWFGRQLGEFGPREIHGRHTGDADRARRSVDDNVVDGGLEEIGDQLLGSTSASVALCTADPPICNDRDPPVPPPRGTRSVSPSTSVMRSMGIPVCSDTSIANDV